VWQDITTSTTIVIDSAARVTVSTHDRGEPGSNDSIMWTVKNSTGVTLYYQSNSSEQTIGGGNIQNKVSPQLAAGGQGPGGTGVAPLAPEQVSAVLTAAVDRWATTGLPAADVARLRAVTVAVADLPDDYLGATVLYGNVISLDADAAGYGWFIDPTPADDA